ncbi:coiled-coil domain-containing protein 74B-like isoform X1 [Lineus longissimus]|uniref:coiled-coil domain-containing protein 74B-like isoform X1 n=1 Tax=Lineus longissimus TaxID=88925 RepID=UPI00315E0006
MASEVLVRPGIVPDAVADMNAQLPPLPNQLPQWSRVSKLDKSRYPKPFLKDRLNPLPPTHDGVKFSDTLDNQSDDNSLESNPEDMNPSQRIQHLEKSIHFLRQQHFEILSSLHEEIDALKKENKELQFKIIMKQNSMPTPPQSASRIVRKRLERSKEREKSASSVESSRTGGSARGGKLDSGTSDFESGSTELHVHMSELTASETIELSNEGSIKSEKDQPKLYVLQEKIKELKMQLQEARNKNIYLTQVLEEEQKKSSKKYSGSGSTAAETVEDVDLTTHPITVTNQVTGTRQPSASDYEAIIRQLQGLNEKQSNELSRLKSDLRDVLYSQKWTPDAYLIAKAYVADEEEDGKQGKLPKIQLKNPSRKMPNVAYLPKAPPPADNAMQLPAMRQTLGNRAAERKKRTQILQKARLRKEVLP